MNTRKLALIAGGSYVGIFFAAIFANFFVLDLVLQAPLDAVTEKGVLVRFGILAFLITAVFDIFVAWALYGMYKAHPLTVPSTYFRLAHAIVMGTAVFALVIALDLRTDSAILQQVHTFNTIWLIGLFFFGVHLMLLARIVKHIRIIPYVMALAGCMYVVDTSAHFLLSNYDTYADVFLALVAIPSMFGEMAFAIWLLLKGGKK